MLLFITDRYVWLVLSLMDWCGWWVVCLVTVVGCLLVLGLVIVVFALLVVLG